MQGGVGSSVAAWVEAVTGGFTAGCGNGGSSAQVGEGGFVEELFPYFVRLSKEAKHLHINFITAKRKQ